MELTNEQLNTLAKYFATKDEIRVSVIGDGRVALYPVEGKIPVVATEEEYVSTFLDFIAEM